jgi:hypothetical protein
VVFSGRIRVAGAPGTVEYVWNRSDRAKPRVQRLRFTEPGVKEVTDTWELGAPGTKVEGWEAIQILRPIGQPVQRSERARFALSCS